MPMKAFAILISQNGTGFTKFKFKSLEIYALYGMSSAVSCWRAFDTTIWSYLVSSVVWIHQLLSAQSLSWGMGSMLLTVGHPFQQYCRSWYCESSCWAIGCVHLSQDMQNGVAESVQGVGKIVGCVGESVQVLFDEKQYQWLMVGFNQKGFSQEIAWNVSHAHVVARTSFSILCTWCTQSLWVSTTHRPLVSTGFLSAP